MVVREQGVDAHGPVAVRGAGVMQAGMGLAAWRRGAPGLRDAERGAWVGRPAARVTISVVGIWQ